MSGAPSNSALQRASRFLYSNARLIDRAAFEVVFTGAPPERLVAAMQGYINPDGGFGHALEPDLRCPDSQPLHTEVGLTVLQQCGVRLPAVADRCCDFLAAIAQPDGALPAHLTGALEYPAAAHWQSGFGAMPTLDRTLGVAALLVWHGARHRWLDYAVAQCRHHVTTASITEAHHLLYAIQFAGALLDGETRRNTLARLGTALPAAEYYVADTPVTRYGLTPLHYAPRPGDPARALFEAASIDDHLDDLAASQMDDGGWPIRFQPPSEGAIIEWRGRWTMEALLTLRAYGRL